MWYTFGCALGVSTTDLDIIEDKGGSQRYFIAMLEEWIRTDNATWEALQEALTAIGNWRLAAKLEEHKQQGTFSTILILYLDAGNNLMRVLA